MKKSLFSILALLIFAPSLSTAPLRSENNLNFPKVTSYRSASCGCCKKWVNHLRSNGLEVVDNVVEDISLIKNQYSIPNNLQSCHTAKMGNYLLEGHVPFESIKKLNLKSLTIVGIAVPGMPHGSPGMEVYDHGSHSHNQYKSYEVFSFADDNREEIFDKVTP